jgi:prepilin-type N-terminal cleavage/methylation domain-containing protein
MKKYKTAFSLIEISVVMVIIAILISGVSSGIDLYDDYKHKIAQKITKNSRVGRINDLELWLETTLDESLSTGTSTFVDKSNFNNEESIGRWKDVNPNTLAIDRNNAIQTSLINQPKYIRKAINGLPALYFDGIDDYIGFYNKILAINNFTIFAVARPEATCTNLATATPGTGGQKYLIYPQHGDLVYDINPQAIAESAGVGVSLCTNSVNLVEHSSGYMPLEISRVITINKPILITVKYSNKVPNLFINSGTANVGSAVNKEIFSSMSFGGGRSYTGTNNYGEHYGYFKGFIAEIIIYSTDLRDNDRKLVENYLIEKWGIK